MIGAAWRYGRDEAWPRVTAIIKGAELWLAVAAGVGMALRGHVFLSRTRTSDLSSVVLSYAAIALGFCLAGMTLVLTFPSREFGEKLANSKLKRNGTTAYSDLLFVFSWTAVVHWLLLVVFVVATLLQGGDAVVLPEAPTNFRRVIVGISTFLGVYAVESFLIILLTLSQVGRVYLKELARK